MQKRVIKTKTYSYTVHLKYFRDVAKTGYLVSVPILPGCNTWGKTYTEALERAEECIQGFLEALTKAGQPIPLEPEPRLPVKTRMIIKAPAFAGL